MAPIAASLIIGIFALCILAIFLYSLVQADLVRNLKRSSRMAPPAPDSRRAEDWPLVTVQLPLYNERYVVERLINSVLKMEYPAGRWEIQILDDSTDDTSQRIDEILSSNPDIRVPVKVFRRSVRDGFKAGALKAGLEECQGELIAIFDADFLPRPDFLQKTVPFFQDSKIGVVQTRWTYLNEGYSLLTRLQAFALNGHFQVEQPGRMAAGCFLNFNGTAGVWRRSAILESGGWQADTITEDLDLSYRAQMKGWKIRYLKEVTAPSELPVEMQGLKSQQFRWTKGAAECARKNLSTLWRDPDATWYQKIHGSFHLGNSALFLLILCMGLVSVPMKGVVTTVTQLHFIQTVSSLSLVSWLLFGVIYRSANRQRSDGRALPLLEFAGLYVLFLTMSLGLSLHNALAALEGYLGIKSPFVRTPKYNIATRQDSWSTLAYAVRKLPPLTWLEAVVFLYFCYGIMDAVNSGFTALLSIQILMALGYGSVLLTTFWQYARRVVPAA